MKRFFYNLARKFVLNQHAKWLKDKKTGLRLVLTGADLRKANFCNADMRQAFFMEASFAGSAFTQSSFNECVFGKAKFNKVEFLLTTFEESDFTYAKFFKTEIKEKGELEALSRALREDIAPLVRGLYLLSEQIQKNTRPIEQAEQIDEVARRISNFLRRFNI